MRVSQHHTRFPFVRSHRPQRPGQGPLGVALLACLTALSAPIAGSATETPAALCLAESSMTIPSTDAVSAASILCDDLRKQGVSVGQAALATENPVEAGADVYRTTLRTLGAAVLIRLAHENAQGDTLHSESMQLDGLEELLVVSPRLTRALLERRDMKESATVSTLAHEETRAYDKKPGEFMWGASVEGLVFTENLTVAPGLGLHAVYELPGAALTSKLAFQAYDTREQTSSAFQFSLGGRKFFGDQNTAFFVGGGIAWAAYTHQTNEDEVETTHWSRPEGNGFELYTEMGVEAFRLYDARLLFGARVSAPLFYIESSRWDYVPEDMMDRETQTREDYIVPVIFNTTILW